MKFYNPKKQQKFSKIDLEKAINDMFTSAQAIHNNGYTFITNAEGYHDLNGTLNYANQNISINMPDDWYNWYTTINNVNDNNTYSSDSFYNSDYSNNTVNSETTNDINNLNTIG